MTRAHIEAERINDDIDGEALSVLHDVAHGGMLLAHYRDDPTGPSLAWLLKRAAPPLAWLLKRGCVDVEPSGLLRCTPIGRLVLDCADVLG